MTEYDETLDHDDKYIHEGMDAYESGADKDTCPYALDTYEAEGWYYGYFLAKRFKEE